MDVKNIKKVIDCFKEITTCYDLELNYDDYLVVVLKFKEDISNEVFIKTYNEAIELLVDLEIENVIFSW